MKKFFSVLLALTACLFFSGCTKKIVILNKTPRESAQAFDNYVKTTGFSYKEKDETNLIYNVLIDEFNYQYFFTAKPMFSYKMGFTCTFNEIDKINTLVFCRTYPQNQGIWNIRQYIKDEKNLGMTLIPYKKYIKSRIL